MTGDYDRGAVGWKLFEQEDDRRARSDVITRGVDGDDWVGEL